MTVPMPEAVDVLGLVAAHLAIDRPDVVKRSYEGALVPGILDTRDSGEYALTKDEVAALPGELAKIYRALTA